MGPAVGIIEQKLDLLEQELKCVICLSIYDNPHSLPCNHQFCYECIMEFFKKGKSQCPLCKLPTIKRAIVKNQILANVIAAYHNLRDASNSKSKLPPSPSPKKRSSPPVSTEKQENNKRARKSLSLDDKAEAKPQDFSLVLDHSPKKTCEVATQTNDSYTRTNSSSSSTFYTPTINRKDDASNSRTTTSTSTSTSPSISPSRRSPKINLKNITDWNSLKKDKPVPPSTATSRNQSSQNTPNKFVSPTRTNQTPPKQTTPNGSKPKPAITNTQTSPKATSPSTHNPPPNHTLTTHPSTSPTLTSPSISPVPLTTPNGTHKNDAPHPPTPTKLTMFYKSGNLLPETETAEEQPAKSGKGNAKSGNVTPTSAKSGNGLGPQPKPRAKSKCENVVVLFTSIDPEGLANARNILKDLGGSMATKYTSDVTHIVTGLTGSFCARRTIKYCLAVTEGKWVVSFDWILHSKMASYFVAEEPFEVEGDSVTQGGPKSAREALSNGDAPLFANCQIYLVGAFTSPTKPEFKRLLQLGGAEVSAKTPAKKLPAKTGKKRGTPNTQIEAIVCNPTAFSSLAKEEVERVKGLGRVVVDMRWVLDCVSFYRILPFTDYELNV